MFAVTVSFPDVHLTEHEVGELLAAVHDLREADQARPSEDSGTISRRGLTVTGFGGPTGVDAVAQVFGGASLWLAARGVRALNSRIRCVEVVPSPRERLIAG